VKEILIYYITTDDFVVDIMTKVLPSGERKDTLIERMLYNIASGADEVHTPRTRSKGFKVFRGFKILKTASCPDILTLK
jgi:hypothetical protein